MSTLNRKIGTHLRPAALLLLLLLVSAVVFAAGGPYKREEVAERYRWNLADIYPDQAAWEKDLARVKEVLLPKAAGYKGRLTSASAIAECLGVYEELSRVIEKAYVYAAMKSDENQADNDALEAKSRVEALYTEASAATAYIQPEILALPEAKLRQLQNEKKLAEYGQLLRTLLYQKPHTLGTAEEELLAGLGDFAGSPEEIYTQARTADLRFPTIKDAAGKDLQLSNALYGRILEHQDRAFRKRAFEGVFGSFEGIKNTLAATLAAEVKKHVYLAKVRKYPSALDASLAAEFIPRGVYDNLISSVNKNLESLHKYIALRRRVLAVDQVHLYDMYVPLVEDYEMNIPYDEARRMVAEAVTVLGPEYRKELNLGFESRWIDVYETENKMTGGYQWGSYDTHPYVLLNYTDSLDDALTLAHEMGHAINASYTNKAQRYLYSGVPIFNAEVASTVNELLLSRHLLARAKTDQERLYLLNSMVETIRGTVYTQVMYAEFELAIHERVEKGDALSAKSLREIWGGLMRKYYGPEFALDELATMWWARIPHFYMNFYVYKYATSLAAANQIVKGLGPGPDQAANQERYLEFLKAGSADFPLATLKKAGVDMTSPAAIDNLLAEFDRLVGEMEALLKKSGRI